MRADASEPVILHVVESYEAGSKRVVELIARSSPFRHVVLAGEERAMTPATSSAVRLLPWPNATREVSPRRDVAALREAVSAIRALRPAVVHCHSSKGGALGRVAARVAGVPCGVVYTPHGVSFLRRDVSPPKRAVFSAAERALQPLGSATVACSRSEQLALRARGIESVLIENGVDEPERPSAPEVPRGAPDALRVVHVGRIDTQKAPDVFGAVARVLRGERVTFTWVGDGPRRSDLTSSGVEVTGWQSRGDVARYLSSADVYFSASRWEGMPLSVLEAMAVGLPLVLSHCEGHVDVVRHLRSGVVFANVQGAASALLALRDDPEARARFGREARASWERSYRAERMSERYHHLYEALMADGRRAST